MSPPPSPRARRRFPSAGSPRPSCGGSGGTSSPRAGPACATPSRSARACAACALVLAAARGRSLRGGRGLEPRVRRHPPAPRVEARGGLRGGVPRAAALVVPRAAPRARVRARVPGSNRARSQTAANAEVRRLRRLPPPSRDDATRRAARARDDAFFLKRDGRGGGIRTDAERYTRARGDTYSAAKAHPTTVAMMIGVLLEVLIDVARIASPARVPPSRRRARNASTRDLSNATSRDSASPTAPTPSPRSSARWRRWRATRRAGGEDAARWLELLRQENALPPTTALVLVRDAAARETCARRNRRNRAGTRFAAAFPAATSRTTALGRAGRRMIPTGRHRSTKGRSTRGRRLSPRRILRRVRRPPSDASPSSLSRRTTRRRAWRSRW